MRFSTWKPSTTVTINYGHPLAKGIAACFLFNEGGGPFVDLVSNTSVPTQGSGARGSFNFGDGLDCRGAPSGATAPAWSRLIGVAPKAIVWRGQIHSSPTAFSGIAGVGYDNAVVSPGYKIILGSGTVYRLEWNSGGFYGFGDVAASVAFDGTERQLVGNWDDAGGFNNGSAELWEDRVRLINLAGVGVSFTYGTTPPLDIGTDTFAVSRDSKSVCRHLFMYDRFLSPTEIQWLLDEPYAFIRATRVVRYSIPSSNLSVQKADNLNFWADGFSYTGGDPNFQIQLGDSLHQSDSTLIVQGLLKTFADTVNAWADAAATMIGIPVAVFDSNQFNWADALSLQLLGPLTVSKADTMSLSDAVVVALLNVKLNVSAADSMNTMADAIRLFNRLRLEFGDNFVISDALRMRFTHLLRTAETLNAWAESVHVDLPARPSFFDDMNNFSDAVSLAMSALVTRTASDQLSMTDAVTVQLVTPYNPATDILRIRRYLNDTE